MRDRDDSERLLAAVAAAVSNAQALAICGRGSKAFLSTPPAGAMLAVGDHAGVIEYRPEELVITARSGTPLIELKRLLASHDQMMAFDPPTFGADGSLGGAIAAGISGPGRPWYGAVRDAVLGVTLINGRAQRLKFGGQVMKNVAGYDVSRLMTGAFGTLGVLLDVSVKVMPRPQFEWTRAFEIDRDEALANVATWARTPLPLSATCHLDRTLYVRLSGTEKGVRAAMRQLGGADVSYADELWESLRDQYHRFFVAAQCWRIVVPPAAPFPDLDGAWLTEWAGAQRWLKTSVPAAEIVAAVRRHQGHAAPFFGGPPLPALDAALLKYHRRVKEAFDPSGIFNRGRLFPES
jgi:glycolate oxidase FAD binding subunit